MSANNNSANSSVTLESLSRELREVKQELVSVRDSQGHLTLFMNWVLDVFNVRARFEEFFGSREEVEREEPEQEPEAQKPEVSMHINDLHDMMIQFYGWKVNAAVYHKMLEAVNWGFTTRGRSKFYNPHCLVDGEQIYIGDFLNTLISEAVIPEGTAGNGGVTRTWSYGVRSGNFYRYEEQQ